MRPGAAFSDRTRGAVHRKLFGRRQCSFSASRHRHEPRHCSVHARHRGAHAKARVANVGAEIDGVLRHAKDLLDIVDEELLQVDRTKHGHVFEAASTLREKLSSCATSCAA